MRFSRAKKGKTAGKDSIYDEHYVYAHDRVSVLLSMGFNAVFIHGYIPDSLMDTMIIPIIKDKKGNVTDKHNYRPIAVTSICSKLVELVILGRYRDCLQSNHNQFGFKRKLGTDNCIYTLKQVIEYYR